MPPTLHATSRLGRLARWCFAHRWRVIAAWTVALILAIAGARAVGGDLSADYATPGSDSKAAAGLVKERFGGRTADTVGLVWTSPDGARSAQASAAVQGVLDRAATLPGFAAGTELADAQVSSDGRTGVVRIPLDRRATSVPESSGAELRELAESSPGGVTMALAGDLVPGTDDEGAISSELIGVLVAALVLLVTFGTVVAAGLPIGAALFGLGVSSAGIGLLAALVDTPDWAPQVAAIMGLGVGIDYALLIVTRYRGEIARGAAALDAAGIAMATAGRSVLVAGTTVVLSLMGLFLIGLPYLYAVALASMLSVAVVVVAAVTLLPALLGLAGPRIDALQVPFAGRGPMDGDGARAAGWARAVQRRPWTATIVGVLVLAVLAAPLTGLRLGQPDAGNNPSTSTSRQAYDLLAAGFGPGANGPLIVAADLPSDASRAAVDDLATAIAREPGVQEVAPVAYNAPGDAAMIAVTPTTSPQDQATRDLVERLRDGPLAASGLADVHVGGQTAAAIDQGDATAARLPVFIAAVVGLSLLLLLVAFRAPVVALKAAMLNLISIAAAYGVVALLAEGGWAGQLVGIDTDTPVAPFIPVMMFAILFGLSMDYEVFLLSRVREERDRLGSSGEAVVGGVARTARVITAAALIMAAVAGAFVFSPVVSLKLIGAGIAAAILIDATIVRLVLVPAVMALLGERSWWLPRWMDRLLPDARLEAPEPASV